jgi:hypothetical protein
MRAKPSPLTFSRWGLRLLLRRTWGCCETWWSPGWRSGKRKSLQLLAGRYTCPLCMPKWPRTGVRPPSGVLGEEGLLATQQSRLQYPGPLRLEHLWEGCQLSPPQHNKQPPPWSQGQEVMASLPRDTLAKVCSRFCQWLEELMDAGGEFFFYCCKIYIWSLPVY